MKIEILKLP